MMWVEILIAGFIFYEAVVVSMYRLLQDTNPAWASWLILISKGIKLLFAVGLILIVPRYTEIPIKQFALIVVAIYFVSLIFETIFFLKKKHNNEQTK